MKLPCPCVAQNLPLCGPHCMHFEDAPSTCAFCKNTGTVSRGLSQREARLRTRGHGRKP